MLTEHKGKKRLPIILHSVDEVRESLSNQSLVPDILTVHPTLAQNFICTAAAQRKFDLLVAANEAGIADFIEDGTTEVLPSIPFGDGNIGFSVDKRDNARLYRVRLQYQISDITDSATFYLLSLKTVLQANVSTKMKLLSRGDILLGALPPYGMKKFNLGNFDIYTNDWMLKRTRNNLGITTETKLSLDSLVFTPEIKQYTNKKLSESSILQTEIALLPELPQRFWFITGTIQSRNTKPVDHITITGGYNLNEDLQSFYLTNKSFTYSQSYGGSLSYDQDSQLLELLLDEAQKIPIELAYHDLIERVATGLPLFPGFWDNSTAFDSLNLSM